MTPPVCYLCAKRIIGQPSTADHTVPKALLEGQPPKMRGYEYGGHLPTHKKCNNEFGPETYVLRALELLDALHNPDCAIKFRHKADPSVPLMALNSACLPNFAKRDLKYFKIMDRRTHGPAAARPSVAALRRSEPVDPFKSALDTALAVLFKSAAALVIRKKTKLVPSAWQVMAVPYVGDASAVDFDEILGSSKPFSPKVKAWVGLLVTGDALAVYRTQRVLVYFFFRFSNSLDGWRHMRGQFVGHPRLRFDGTSVLEVLHSGWKRV
jgi:hypothetical protein